MQKSLTVLGLLLLAGGVAGAQTGGEITGEVRDQSGAVALNASVTATNTATNVSRSTLTNEAGVYSFPDLTPRPYRVRVTVTGFANAVSNLECRYSRPHESISR